MLAVAGECRAACVDECCAVYYCACLIDNKEKPERHHHTQTYVSFLCGCCFF